MNREAEFQTTAKASQDGSWLTSSRDELEVGIPPEFDGDYDGLAPENLYALSLTNCFVATFKAIADRSGFSFETIEAEGTLHVGKKNGETMMKTMNLDVTLEGVEDEEKADLLLEKTENNCWILNSVQTEVNVSTEVN